VTIQKTAKMREVLWQCCFSN